MMGRDGAWARRVAIPILLGLAGCTSTPDAGSATKPVALPRLAAGGDWETEHQFTSRAGDPPVERGLICRWREDLTVANGRVRSLLLLPRGAWWADLTGQDAAPTPLPLVRGCEVKVDEATGNLLLGVRADRLPAAEVAGWRTRFATLLFLEEVLYACIPPPDVTPMESWLVNLDAAGFARRSRFGTWPDPTTLKGEVGFAKTDPAPPAGYVRLVGIVEVGRPAGKVLRLQVDLLVARATGLIESAVVRGASPTGNDPKDPDPLSNDFLWRLLRKPLPAVEPTAGATPH